MNKQVFISYRHESPEYALEVRRLGELLRKAGLPVLLDQFYMDEHPGGPNEGWPKWCEDATTRSDCVLIIGSPGWFAVFEGRETPGKGCGAASEAALVRQELYDNQGDNPRIRLAYLQPLGPEQVPPRLRAWHHFRPFDNKTDKEGLIKWIASRLGTYQPSEVVQLAGSGAEMAPQPGPTARTNPDSLFPRDLIEFLAEAYPDVRDARAVWQRAGGRNADVENNPRPFDLWQQLWRRSAQGAAVQPRALLLVVREDYPGNPLIARHLDFWPDTAI